MLGLVTYIQLNTQMSKRGCPQRYVCDEGEEETSGGRLPLKRVSTFRFLPDRWNKNTTPWHGANVRAVLLSFTVDLQRLRLSPLHVWGMMKQVWYNDHQIWIRSFTVEEGMYGSD